MLVASKESIARVRGYKSPLLAATIVLTIVYIFGTGVYSMVALESEHQLAVPTVLKSRRNAFESDSDTVYLLVRNCERPHSTVRDVLTPANGRLNIVYQRFDNRARDFQVTCAGVSDSKTPKLFWLTKSESISGVQHDTRIFAAFYMAKGQRMSIDVKWLPDAGQKKQQLALVRLGTRMPEFFPHYDYAGIKSGKFLSSGHLLSTDDLVVNYKPASLPGSPLELPLPLIGDGSQLKLKTRLLAGEQIKSSMLELPGSEEELKKFLAMRNLEVSEGQNSPGRDK